MYIIVSPCYLLFVDDLSESFNSHPPLVLPGQGFMLDMCRQVNDNIFYDIISEAEALFGPNTGEWTWLYLNGRK